MTKKQPLTEQLAEANAATPAKTTRRRRPSSASTARPAAEAKVEPTMDAGLAEASRPAGAWMGATALALSPSVLDPDPDNVRSPAAVGVGTDPSEQPLEALAASLIAQGMLQPVIARPADVEGRYVIVAGHRRVAAAILAGLDEVPVLVRADLGADTARAAATQLVENLHREDLSPLERARGYYRLQHQFGMKQADIAAAVGVNQGTVSKTLSLLKLPAMVQERVDAGRMPIADAVDLAKLTEDAAAAAVDLMDKQGISAGSAVTRARQDTERADVIAAASRAVEKSGLAVFDYPDDWDHAPYLPLAADDEGHRPPGVMGVLRRGLVEVPEVLHRTLPCHAAVIYPHLDANRLAITVLVCTDPASHGVPTLEELESRRADQAAAERAEREAAEAAANAALQARHVATRAAAVGKVPKPAMTEFVALSYSLGTLLPDGAGVPSDEDLADVLDFLGVDVAEGAYADQLEPDLLALIDAEPLRVAFVASMISVDACLTRLYGPHPRVAQAFLKLLTDHAGYEPSDEERLVAYPAPPTPLTEPMPEGQVPDDAVAWYGGAPGDLADDDPPRWIEDADEASVIARVFPARVTWTDDGAHLADGGLLESEPGRPFDQLAPMGPVGADALGGEPSARQEENAADGSLEAKLDEVAASLDEVEAASADLVGRPGGAFADVPPSPAKAAAAEAIADTVASAFGTASAEVDEYEANTAAALAAAAAQDAAEGSQDPADAKCPGSGRTSPANVASGASVACPVCLQVTKTTAKGRFVSHKRPAR